MTFNPEILIIKIMSKLILFIIYWISFYLPPSLPIIIYLSSLHPPIYLSSFLIQAAAIAKFSNFASIFSLLSFPLFLYLPSFILSFPPWVLTLGMALYTREMRTIYNNKDWMTLQYSSDANWQTSHFTKQQHKHVSWMYSK